MRIPEPNDMNPTPPQTEDAAESGLVEEHDASPDPKSYRDLGKTHAPDDDDIGDIADEGPGHRG
jgi:hypothetical protein